MSIDNATVVNIYYFRSTKWLLKAIEQASTASITLTKMTIITANNDIKYKHDFKSAHTWDSRLYLSLMQITLV